MSAVEDRIRQLAAENMAIEEGSGVDLDANVADSGASSVAIVAFVRLVSQELNVELPPENVSQMNSLRDLVNYIEAASG